MADIVKGLKNVWMKGMEAIGDTASNIANNTKFKVQEMNLINRRHEILADFGSTAYALWQQGVQFPDELQQQLEELSKVDETLNTLRAERLAYLQTIEEEKAARAAAEETAEETPAVEETPAEEQVMPEEEAVPVMDIPEDPVEMEENEPAPSLEIPVEETAEETADEVFEDAIDKLLNEDAPSAPEAPQTAAPARSAIEEKVGKALDTVQAKVSKLGKVIDRSVQNLAKVVLQNEDKQDKSSENGKK